MINNKKKKKSNINDESLQIFAKTYQLNTSEKVVKFLVYVILLLGGLSVEKKMCGQSTNLRLDSFFISWIGFELGQIQSNSFFQPIWPNSTHHIYKFILLYYFHFQFD